MITFLVSATATLVFIIYCCSLDSVGGGSNKFHWVLFRLVARHVKLALLLAFGFLMAFITIMGILAEAGAYSESMTPYGGGPQLATHRGIVGKAWHTGASLLAPLALLVCILSSSVRDFYVTHMTACNWVLFDSYLVWLGFTIYALVSNELRSDSSRSTVIVWSAVTAGVWAALVLLTARLAMLYWTALTA